MLREKSNVNVESTGIVQYMYGKIKIENLQKGCGLSRKENIQTSVDHVLSKTNTCLYTHVLTVIRNQLIS